MYQLYSTTKLLPGDPFLINGPYDRYGFVYKSQEILDGEHKGEFLNLVRGTGEERIPKHMVNQYIQNGFKLNTEEPIKNQKTIRGLNFKQIKSLIDCSSESIKIYSPNRNGYAFFKVIENLPTKVILQKIGSGSHPVICIQE